MKLVVPIKPEVEQMEVTRLQYVHTLLVEMNLPVQPANELAWLALSANEYSDWEPGPGHDMAEWNPFDTTMDGFGGTDFNSVGVKNYPTMPDGIGATAATVNDGRYEGALALMRDEYHGQAVPRAVAILIALQDGGWGSINTNLAQQVANAWSRYGNLVVAGSTVAPPPRPTLEDDMQFLVKNSAGAEFVVAGDLSHKVGITDQPDAQALVNTGQYPDLALSDAMIEKIPTVA